VDLNLDLQPNLDLDLDNILAMEQDALVKKTTRVAL
jgi:hypothetical protein